MVSPFSLPVTRPEDMVALRPWAARLQDPQDLPISLCCDGTRVTGIPAAWNPGGTSRRLDANLVETVWQGLDPATGLTIRVECLIYQDFPVVEWTVWLENTGSSPSPVLSEILALDSVLPATAPVLHHGNGDFYSEEGYTPTETPLLPGTEVSCIPNGGRPCDGAFPYFRLHDQGRGYTLAVGWPAQWSARFTGVKEGVAVQAGQARTRLRLFPGERVRTPRITLMVWTGEPARAVNLWRRWFLAHVMPKPDGRSLRPLLAVAGTDEGEEFTAATEENQLRFQDQFRRRGIDFDVWWIDAGWYPCRNPEGERRWWLTGTWQPDEERFPRGLRPVADHAAIGGARLLIWFEPERVTRNSRLFAEHPEWLLQRADEATRAADANALLNLGNPDCRRWLTDHVCGQIQEHGIGVYRQDFNFPPLDYWRENDAEDRQGWHENQHVQGYLQYWDELLARNPGLWIDSCSSGGRRNDLETMRRSVPLHYTDYGYGRHPVKLAFHHTLYAWIPYFKDVTLSWDGEIQGDEWRYDREVDRYAFHCGMAPMFVPALDIHRDDYDFALARELVALWRRAADLLLYGDYYPLTRFSRSPEEWVAWQFNRPERGDGLVQGIRHAACVDETLIVVLRDLDAEAEYRLENPETKEELVRTGAELMERGFDLTLSPRSAAIWFYRRR
ncbi:MAG: alpha-galactosidase [Candidatus Latescibacterota bacterium]